MERIDSGNWTEIQIDESSAAAGKRILDIGFPRAALIALIKRNGSFITPNGSTVIEPNDTLVIIAENSDSLKQVYECLYPGRLEEKA